jgi:hypothetical protein
LIRLLTVVALVAASTAVAACEWGDKEPSGAHAPGTPWSPATSRDAASPPPAAIVAAGTCGSAVELSLDEPSPLGKTFAEDDRVEVHIRYSAPGCVRARVFLYGFHPVGTRWFEHWCQSGGRLPTCNDDGLPSHFNLYGRSIDGEGVVTFVAQSGGFPPFDASSAPDLEGFVLCIVDVAVNDGVLGGAVYQEDFVHAGDGCPDHTGR